MQSRDKYINPYPHVLIPGRVYQDIENQAAGLPRFITLCPFIYSILSYVVLTEGCYYFPALQYLHTYVSTRVLCKKKKKRKKTFTRIYLVLTMEFGLSWLKSWIDQSYGIYYIPIFYGAEQRESMSACVQLVYVQYSTYIAFDIIG